MKKLSAVLAMVVLGAMTAALPVGAATISSDQVKKGTPVIDGKLDEIYKQSASYQLDEDDIGVVFSNYDGEKDHDGMAHFLWDETHLYFCIDVQDDDVVSHGQDYIDENGKAAWMNDAVENWFYIDDAYLCKVHNDAFGLTMFVAAEQGQGEGTPEFCFLDNGKYAVTTTSTGYTIEVACELNPEVLAAFKAGDTIGYSMQLNDIQTEAGDTIYCSGSQNPNENIFTLSAEEAVVPAAPAEDVPADAAAGETTAPVTADAGILAASLVMAAAAGVVLSKKH